MPMNIETNNEKAMASYVTLVVEASGGASSSAIREPVESRFEAS